MRLSSRLLRSSPTTLWGAVSYKQKEGMNRLLKLWFSSHNLTIRSLRSHCSESLLGKKQFFSIYFIVGIKGGCGVCRKQFWRVGDCISPICWYWRKYCSLSLHFVLKFSMEHDLVMCSWTEMKRSPSVNWLKTYQIISAHMLERRKSSGSKGKDKNLSLLLKSVCHVIR